VSELFIRLNTVADDDRWSRLGRLLMLQQVGTAVNKQNADSKNRDTGTRFQRAAAHAVNWLQWSMQLREEHSRGPRNQHLFSQPPAGLLPSSDECSSMHVVTLTAGLARVAQDCWSGWGAQAIARHVHVYTDGSHDAHSKPMPTSSWAVTVADRWLDDNFAAVPADERLLSPAHVGDAVSFGASITASSGVYPAELQAIARALAMFPLSCSLHIHSDSQAALAGIHAYSNEVNSRKRLRMAARPLLQLVHHQLTQRRAAGGAVQFEHIRAHSDAVDIHSVGNRITDYTANTTRLRPAHPSPLTVRELPLAECEHRLTVWTQLGRGQPVIDDIRRAALAQLKTAALGRWAGLPASPIADGSFACAALLDTSRVVLAHGSASQQATFVHVATNSIHACWHKQADGSRARVQPLLCATCATPLTLAHLSVCPSDGAEFRMKQRVAWSQLLASCAESKQWHSLHWHLSFTALLLRLFPPPPGVPNDLHITRLMCGVFSAQQSNAAAKLLGFAVAADGTRLMQQLRLCCLDGVHHFFHARKIAAS
jgi:ribonuclease HI